MNAAPPSFTDADLARLRDRLRALAAAPDRHTDHGRILPLADRSAIAAIRSEISETQSPRRLTFRNDRGEMLTVEARAGRLLGLVSASPNASAPTEISETDQTTLQKAAEILRLFATRSAALTVEAAILGNAAQRPASGVAIEKLLPRDKAPSKPPTPEARIAALVAVASDTAIALLHLRNGTEVAAKGAPDALANLRQLAASESANPNASATDAPTEHCVIFSAHPDRDRTILCAALNTDLVFVLMRSGALAGIYTAWSAA